MLPNERARSIRIETDSARSCGAALEGRHSRGCGTPCYDRSTPKLTVGKSVRSLIALVMLVLPSAAASAGMSSREVWHAVATPSRAALPTVTIDLGYPGPYLSPDSSPITLRATAGNLPFNGYIGYHLAVKNVRAFNPPVITRAVLRPHQSWSWTTQLDLHYFGDLKREIVIEWLDGSMDVVATGNAGVPPWSARANRLRVIARGQTVPSLSVGDSLENADSLPLVARWYSGFRSLIIPVAVWLDLSPDVRKTIFASGIYVVFSGLPTPSQRMDAIDQALLPITFDPRPGAYDIPWPYRSPTSSGSVAVPMTWRAKQGASWAGSPALPYIVSNQVAAWVADGTALDVALPAMTVNPIHQDRGWRSHHQPTPKLTTFVRSFLPAVAALFAALLSIAFWVVMRKSPRPAVAVAAAIASALILLGRDQIRPSGSRSVPRREQRPPAASEGIYTYESFAPRAPGVTEHVSREQAYGASPLPEKPASLDVMRNSITQGNQRLGDVEVRSATTAPGWGALVSRRGPWETARRYSRRSELGESPVVRVQSRDDQKLVIDYESPIAVDRVFAEWASGDIHHFGEVAAPGGSRGRVTIEDGMMLGSASHSAWSYGSPPPQGLAGCSVRVSLMWETRSDAQTLQWVEPFPPSAGKPTSFSIRATPEAEEAGTMSRLFALPVALIPTGAGAVIGVSKPLSASEVTVSSAAGSMRLPPAVNQLNAFEDVFVIPAERFGELIRQGGILKVTLKRTGANTDRFGNIWIKVLEKKP